MGRRHAPRYRKKEISLDRYVSAAGCAMLADDHDDADADARVHGSNFGALRHNRTFVVMRAAVAAFSCGSVRHELKRSANLFL